MRVSKKYGRKERIHDISEENETTKKDKSKRERSSYEIRKR